MTYVTDRIHTVVTLQQLMTTSHNAEAINMLLYKKGQEYKPHYDCGADGTYESRFITIGTSPTFVSSGAHDVSSSGMYFNTPTAGGATVRACPTTVCG